MSLSSGVRGSVRLSRWLRPMGKGKNSELKGQQGGDVVMGCVGNEMRWGSEENNSCSCV